MSRWSIAFVSLGVAGLGGLFLAPLVTLGQAPGTALVTPREPSSFRDVVKKVLPAVVSIETKAKPKVKPKGEQPRRRGRAELPPGMPEEFRKFFEDFEGRQFDGQFGDGDEAPTHGFGSGFVVDAKGVILTNNHVVAGTDQVEVTLQDGRKFLSKDIKTDQKTDLAIVRIDAKNLPSLELGDSDAMEIGDRVLAVGAPFGLTGTVTSGIISAKGRNGLSMNMYEDFLQTDAAINPGNSGGPLVNLEGKVIGINAAIKSRSGGFQGIGLAIASTMAKNVMQQLLTDGVVHRGYLGVQIKDLDPDVAAKLNVPSSTGVVVGSTFDDSPAAKAGLQPGDVIVGLAGKPVKNGRELQRVVAGLPLKKPVDLSVFRDGKSKQLSVTIEEQPQTFGTTAGLRTPGKQRKDEEKDESVSVEKLGVVLGDLTPELAEKLSVKANAGAVVTAVEPGGPAAEAGLRSGVVIQKVDGKAVKSAEAAAEALKKGSLSKGILLFVQSPRSGAGYVLLKGEPAKE